MNIPSYCSSNLFYTNQKMIQHKNNTFSVNTLVTYKNAKTSTNGTRLYYEAPADNKFLTYQHKTFHT